MGRTARSARCPLAADCRTQAPFSALRRRKDPQSLDRSEEPSEVNNGLIKNSHLDLMSHYQTFKMIKMMRKISDKNKPVMLSVAFR